MPKKKSEPTALEILEAVVPEIAAENSESSSSSETVDGAGATVAGVAPLARMFGYDVNTIRKWIDKGLPYLTKAEKRGDAWTFDFEAVHKWIVQNEIAKALANAPTSAVDDEELKAWKLLREKSDALQSEHNLAESRGLMIRMDDAVREREEADGQVKAALDALPGRYCDKLALATTPPECMTILKKAVEEVKNNLVLVFSDTPELEGDIAGVDLVAPGGDE